MSIDLQQSGSVFLYFRSSYDLSVPPSNLPELLVRTDRRDARKERIASREFVQGSVYPSTNLSARSDTDVTGMQFQICHFVYFISIRLLILRYK